MNARMLKKYENRAVESRFYKPAAVSVLPSPLSGWPNDAAAAAAANNLVCSVCSRKTVDNRFDHRGGSNTNSGYALTIKDTKG